MTLDSRSMAEHNFGTPYSLLIIFCFTKFVSENSLKMKAKFLVEKSQYQWFFPLSRRKNPTDTCQTGFKWNICEFQMVLSSAPSRTDSLRLYPSHQSPHSIWALQPGEGGIMGIPGGAALVPGPPGASVSSVQCQFLVALTPPVPSSFPFPDACQTLFQLHSGLLLTTEDHSFSRSPGWLSESPFFSPQDNHWKWCSLAILLVTLKLPLGKGRKSQKQICIPNSRRAAPLSVETVGQKWREMKHAPHVTAPLAWSSWEVASHCQPFCWGHFYPTLCTPFVLLEEDGSGGHPSFSHNPAPRLGVSQILNSLCFFVYYLKQKHLYLLTQSRCLLQLLCTGNATLNWSLLTRSNHAQNKT